MSRYVQALLDVDLRSSSNGSSKKTQSRVRFLFMTRHPLANALAHRHFLPDQRHITLPTLFENWLAVSAYIAEDQPFLAHSLLVKLEELTANPTQVLHRVRRFLDMPEEMLVHEASDVVVHSDPNAKYERQYCELLRTYASWREQHLLLRRDFGDAVKNQGYDLDLWSCIAAALAPGKSA